MNRYRFRMLVAGFISVGFALMIIVVWVLWG